VIQSFFLRAHADIVENEFHRKKTRTEEILKTPPLRFLRPECIGDRTRMDLMYHKGSLGIRGPLQETKNFEFTEIMNPDTAHPVIAEMMETYRQQPPSLLAGSPVVSLLDYQLQQSTNLVTGEKTPIQLPKSNVLQFITADGSKISARPSGTEPKIKFYVSVNAALSSAGDFDGTFSQLQDKVKLIQRDLNLV
jgi:hypothetical protein